MRAFQHVGDARYAHAYREIDAEGIHGFHRRQPQRIAARSLEAAGIGLRRPRVAGEILARPELGRIHEHAGDDPVRMPARQRNQ